MGQEPKKKEELFSKLHQPEAAADLARKTLLIIAARERRFLIAKLFGFAVLFAASLAVVVVEFTAVGAQIGRSGFLQFGSLFFSDFGAAAGLLPEFFLSLLESFPIFSAGLAVGGLAIAIWSCAGFVDDATILRAGRS